MLENLKKEKNLIRILLILLIIAVGSYVFTIVSQILGNFSDIIITLLVAWIVSFIIEPLVDLIGIRIKLSRIWATLATYILIFAGITAIIFLFLPIVSMQFDDLTRVVRNYLITSPEFINQAGTFLAPYLNNSVTIIPSLAQFFLNIFIVLIFSFYITVDKDTINKALYMIVPKKWHQQLRFSQNLINDVFASFLRVQLLFGVIIFVSTWITLSILQVEFADSTALLSGIFGFFPMIGPIIALIPPVFVALLKDQTTAVIVFTILLIEQQFIFNVIGPNLLGNAFKVHPAIVLLSFLLGFKLAGVAGAMFAIPVLGILAVITRDLGHHFLKPQTEKKS